MQPSKLPYIFGILLIMGGPLLLVSQLVTLNSGNRHFHLTNAVVRQKEKQKDSVLLKVKLFELVTDSLPVAPTLSEDANPGISTEKEVDDTLENSHYAFSYASERKHKAELNGDDDPGNSTTALLKIDPKLADKYNVGDTFELRYNEDDHTRVKLKEDASAQKKNAGSWLA
ncbi:MAG TPA: hypothetical protein VI112_10055, partial [Bacteroidia bacterium]